MDLTKEVRGNEPGRDKASGRPGERKIESEGREGKEDEERNGGKERERKRANGRPVENGTKTRAE